MSVSEQQVRNIVALHTGKMHEALNRELDTRVVERLAAQDGQLESIQVQLETLRRLIVGTA